MITVKTWDNTPINNFSNKIKEEVSKSVATYVIEHWDECVKSTIKKIDNKFEGQFFITL